MHRKYPIFSENSDSTFLVSDEEDEEDEEEDEEDEEEEEEDETFNSDLCSKGDFNVDDL